MAPLSDEARGAAAERAAILRMLQTLTRACDRVGLSDEATVLVRVALLVKQGRHLQPDSPGKEWVSCSAVPLVPAKRKRKAKR